jgi:cardiolipin synthase
MFHCKALIVDSQLVSVGSTNFDNRSFRLNDEANLNVYDGEFAAKVERVFEEDLRRSRRVTLESWASRPWQEKLVEQFSSLFASQM